MKTKEAYHEIIMLSFSFLYYSSNTAVTVLTRLCEAIINHDSPLVIIIIITTSSSWAGVNC